MKKTFISISSILLMITLIFSTAGFAQNNATKKTGNKQIVTDFFDLAFVKRQPIEAAEKYISPDKYIQHNPMGKDGREAFLKGFANYVITSKYQAVIKRVIAEGDLVVVHSQGFNDPKDPKDRGEAAIDIFRVENGKIVEHWDVVQPVPETSNNSNTMF